MNYSTRNSKGQVLVLVALMIVVLVGVAALALDIGRAYGVRARLNAAVDAASYEATKAMGQGTNEELMKYKATDVATAYFKANYPATGYLGAIPSEPQVTSEHDASTGLWKVSVEATAEMPTLFAGVVGRPNFSIKSSSESQRRSLDTVLVLDTSYSLEEAGVFGAVKTSSQDYVDLFSEVDDRFGLVAFSTGAEPLVSVCREKNPPQNPAPNSLACGRGFDKDEVKEVVGSLNYVYSTNSEEGMKKALDQLNSLRPSSRSSTRVIVFFSDGAPNTINGRFALTSGGTAVGNLFSETTSGAKPTRIFDQTRYDDRNGQVYNNLWVPLAIGGTDVSGTVPLASYNNIRSFSGGTSDREFHCDVNRAARNMVENVANQARSQGVFVFTLGLGKLLNEPEVADCGYTQVESGANLLKRMANTTDSDTHNDAQPTGIYCFAATSAQLKPCFDQIASMILHITR